ncbi:MAG: Rpn family recombination-promoting nuclease/putative transposase [Prevotellaceae bacterium]|jgi:hypothetical protein|nr:Rpn family recombination-promoting nuclease/putative transposase [Prevotellaceae bacterium]
MARVFISFNYALKRLLHDKANYNILGGFLSELFMFDVQVENISKSESESNTDRYSITVKNKKDEILLVELQFNPNPDYFIRMLYETSKILIERAEEKQFYAVLPKVISINIVNLNLEQGTDYIYHGSSTFQNIYDDDDELQLNYSQQKHYDKETPTDIYPEYYILNVQQFNDKVKNKLDEWIYYLKNNSVKDEFTAKGLDKVRTTLLYENLTPEEQKEYDEGVKN